RPAGCRLLRPEGRPAGGGRPPHGARPRPRARAARAPHRARRGRPRALLAQPAPLPGRARGGARPAAGARDRRSRPGEAAAGRPRRRLRRDRPVRPSHPCRGRPLWRHAADRQHPPERSARMSTPPAAKLPLTQLVEMKRAGEKIVMVTAYDAPGARFAEDAGIDVVLVGDTAAMVVLGYEGTTVPVTVDEMLFLTRTVARQVRRPLVVGDLPFGSYQVSDEDAVRTAIRFVKEAGADIVKLEGAGPMVSR